MIINVFYDGGYRLVEPHTVGTNKNTSKQLLRAYQVQGVSLSGEAEGWKILNLSKIESIELTEDTFEPRPDYRRGDSVMTGGIIAEV